MNIIPLTDEDFVQKMKEKLEEWKKKGDEFSHNRVAWELMKYNVCLFSINYSKELAKTKREREEKLQRNLQIAETLFEQNPCEEVEKIQDDCNAELDNFYEEKAYGLLVHARARWLNMAIKVQNIF